MQEIYAIKELPDEIELDGDYNITQAALFLGALCYGPLTLKKYNAGRDTAYTVDFLTSLGVDIEIYESAIVMNYSEFGSNGNGGSFKLTGSIITLSLAIGLMVGKNIVGTVEYDGEINPDAVDELVMLLNKEGLDVAHFDPAHCSEYSTGRGVVIIRDNRLVPIHRRIKSIMPFYKACLLMYGFASGCTVVIEEEYKTDDWLEMTANFLKAGITIRDARQEWQADPHDPRKRAKVTDMEFARLITLGPSSKLSGGEMVIPTDVYETAALMAFAVLQNREIVMPSVYLNRALNKYLQHLKACGCDYQISNRDQTAGWPLGDLRLQGAKPKSRKLAENPARSIAEFYPLIAVMAAIADGTTLMRDLDELDAWYFQPFAEIVENLGHCGIKGGVLEDGFIIEAVNELNGDDFGPFGNRPVALAFYILARCGKGRSTIADYEIITENFPGLAGIFQEKILKTAGISGDG